MVFEEVGKPLRALQRDVPQPAPGQVLVRVLACGVCRTDLHLIDGEVKIAAPPRILGHQIVGVVEATGQHVGVPWLGWTCGICRQCRAGRENLCEDARFTGCDIDGGFAEYAVADARYCFALPPDWPPAQAAPLLCAGLIGFRALRMCGDARRLGIFGFGAAGHIVAQVAAWQGRELFAYTRPGDKAAQALARELGAVWAGSSQQQAPEQLDAAIIFAPDGALVPVALGAVIAGGSVVCGGIHMSKIPGFAYERLWHERTLRSVANLTRADGEQFLPLAEAAAVRTEVTTFALTAANEALDALRRGRFQGAGVLRCR